MKHLHVSVALFALLPWRSAEANAILDFDGRFLSSRAFGQSDGVQDHELVEVIPCCFAPFNESLTVQAAIGGAGGEAASSQNSSVTTSLFSGTGAIGLSAFVPGESPRNPGIAGANSSILIQFSLSDPHTFDFTGLLSLEASSSVSGDTNFLHGSFVLFETGFTHFDFLLDSVPGSRVSLAVTQSGILPPDDYRFIVDLFGDVGVDETSRPLTTSGRGEFDFEFRLNEIRAVPEPSSLWLLALGVCAVIFMKQPLRAAGRERARDEDDEIVVDPLARTTARTAETGPGTPSPGPPGW